MNKYEVQYCVGHTQEVYADYLKFEDSKILFIKNGCSPLDSTPEEITSVPDHLVAVFVNPISVLVGGNNE